MGIRSIFSRKSKAKKSKSASAQLSEAIDLRSLQQLAIMFEILDKFRKARLIYIDFRPEHMSVTISMFLAQHYIFDEDPAVWAKFLSQCELWATFQYNVNVYNRSKSKFMADYQSKAYADNPDMEPEDVAAMKMEAAEIFHRQINENPDPVPPFTFYVLGATTDAAPLLVARRLTDPDTGASEFRTLPVPDNLVRPDFHL